MDESLPRLRENYWRYAPELVAPLLDVLIYARKAYGGDVDTVLILFSVGLRQAEYGACRSVTVEDFQAGVRVAIPGSGINVRSIAESTGIPRETVRRKVRALQQAGLLQRIDNELFCTSTTFADFGEVREAIVRMAARNRRTVSCILAAEG